ncbi:gp53-like domain-containing protein [Actinobacillus pleuropneumoniae]|uniref:gp53-like domain-containing protein n=1 Tax=Actinobacillus pleuropneumoniae TaxID=715 RepID=UPI00223CE0F3|nr:hypothetical protein [Actinobacillus pleuropneumoniae]
MRQKMNPIATDNGRFKDGNPATGEYGTVVTADHMNNVQDSVISMQNEIITVLNEAGITVNADDNTQLWQALQMIAGQVESIAALREFEPVRDRQVVFVKGYYASSNKGGGYFIADFADITTTDNGGTVIVTTRGRRWKRIVAGSLSLIDFGIEPNGDDVGSRINIALDVCAYKYELVADVGTYITNTEIKAPSGTRFRGVGIDRTIIKAGALLPAMSNLITNKSNNYAVRTTKDRDIEVSNLSLDADWRGRYAIGTHINNQGCGVKLSSVLASRFYKVKVSNAALHCFDVCGDQYVDTGNIADTSQNPSELVVFDMCEAWNPYRDDAFTTHNCGNVVFNQCRAYFDGTISELGNTQQGFEADEGSYNITFNDCVATGFTCGYQSKGHATTMPAKNISFNRCVADNCGYGFMASVGTNPTGKVGYKGQAVSFTDCVVNRPNLTLNKIALYIYGADGVRVDGFTVNGDAKVVMTQGVGRVDIENLIFNDELSSNLGIGCVHIESTVTAGVITLRNISSTVAQTLPLIAKTNNATRLHMDNISLLGKGENGIFLNRNPRDTFINGRNQGYTNTVYLSALSIGLTGDVVLEAYNKHLMFGNGAVDANQQIKAPVGTKLYYHVNGKVWTQVSTNLDTPKWLEDIRSEDSRVKLSSLTVGTGGTGRHLAVDGSAIISGGLTVGSRDIVSFASVGYAQAQTPATDDNSGRLATTEWVRRFAALSGSLSANGWTKFANGLIIQWGTYNANAQDVFNFPIAFTRECFVVLPVDYNSTGQNLVTITGTNKTAESFQIQSEGGDVGLFSVIAIGV